MHLSRWICLPLVLTVTLACSDGTAPPPSILDEYFLESVDSRPLPATIHSQGGYTTTVIWSALAFDDAGNAGLVEHMRYTSPNDPVTEQTHTTIYSYNVSGRLITFNYSPPCPPNANCVAPPTGTLDGTTLTLSWGGSPPWRPPALYRLAVRID